MNRAVTELLIPALIREPGFRGAVNLEDRSTGHGMMLTFWDTEDQALRRPAMAMADPTCYSQYLASRIDSITLDSMGVAPPRMVLRSLRYENRARPTVLRNTGKGS
jgi:hypothetical protein